MSVTSMQFLSQIYQETEDGDLICKLCGVEITDQLHKINHLRRHIDEWLTEIKGA